MCESSRLTSEVHNIINLRIGRNENLFWNNIVIKLQKQ